MQRIFNYGKIQNTSLAPDKELNILVYGQVIIYRSYTLLKMVRFSPKMKTTSDWC